MTRDEGDRMKLGLPAIAAPGARLVILGSLPGDASLEQRRYYAHPANQFWRLVGMVIGEDLHALDYPARLDALRAHRIALWDVIGSARRRGGLDQAIRDAALNPLREWLAGFKQLQAVAFNGGSAAAAGRRLLGNLEGLDLVDLPSSSPANTMRLADKANRWFVLRHYLDPPTSGLAPVAAGGEKTA